MKTKDNDVSSPKKGIVLHIISVDKNGVARVKLETYNGYSKNPTYIDFYDFVANDTLSISLPSEG